MNPKRVHVSELKSVEHVGKGDWRETILLAVDNEVPLYTILKVDTLVSFDRSELDQIFDPVQAEYIDLIERMEDIAQIRLSRGTIVQVQVEELEQLFLSQQVPLEKIIPIPQEDSDPQIVSAIGIGATIPSDQIITFRDLFLLKKEVSKLRSTGGSAARRSQKALSPVKECIEIAFSEIGEDATTEELYDWIRNEVESPDKSAIHDNSCFSKIDFEGTRPIRSAQKGEVVIKYYHGDSTKPNVKKTFQNNVDDVKKLRQDHKNS